MTSLAAPIVAALLSAAAAPAQPAACERTITFAEGLTPSAELHVATTGSDAAGDGSPMRPFASIAHAVVRATPGTAVRLHPGTYPGGVHLSGVQGLPSAPIWIGGVPGLPRPLLQGGTTGLQLSSPRCVVLHDLEFAAASGNGVNADDSGQYDNPEAARFLVFQRLLIRDIGGSGNQDGLKLSGVRDFWVVDCEIARTGGAGSGSLIDLVGCHRGLISGCFLHDASGNALQAKGGTSGVVLRWSRLEECGQRAVNIGGSTGPEFFRPPLSTTPPNAEATDVHVVANVIQGATAAVAFVGAVGCSASNNTIITPHNWILRILQESTTTPQHQFLPCGGNTFENNLVYFERADLSTHVNIGPGTDPQSFAFAHNLWFAYDNPASSGPALPVAELQPVIGLDPRLSTPTPQPGADYAINPDGPAARAGRSPAARALTRADFTGRCFNDPPSIGAFEAACRPDFNNDGNVDQDDIEYLRHVIAGGENPHGRNPDFNHDGSVDQDDVSALINTVGGGGCP
ncbi:MAG: hypothetical protein DYG92_13220 [Leptolyngbya sp. PLA1]|nr:hypothetical protein [Leptolyngbya sp. PLA1]